MNDEVIQPMDCHGAKAPRNDVKETRHAGPDPASINVNDFHNDKIYKSNKIGYNSDMKHHYYFCKKCTNSSRFTSHSSHKCAAFTLAEVFHPLRRSKRAAFTLAEVLITLGIIGVVAALTLVPLFINRLNKKILKTELKKTYSEIQQIYNAILSNNESLYISAESNATTNMIYPIKNAQLFMSYLKDSYAVDKNTNWSGIDRRLYNVYNEKGLYSHDGKTVPVMPICDTGGIWIDNTGRIWLFNDNDSQICVDINGLKGPNRIGYDFFVFYPTLENKILPHYYDIENEYVHARNYQDYTYYALIDQHPKNKEKNYWNDYLK